MLNLRVVYSSTCSLNELEMKAFDSHLKYINFKLCIFTEQQISFEL